MDFLAVRTEGERVVLSPVSPEHTPAIFKEFTGDITRYMIPMPLRDMAHTNEFVDRCIENMKAGCEAVFAVTDVGSGEFLGICALHANNDPQTPDLGVWIKKAAHGKRLGREAVRCLVAWARENIVFDYLAYPVDRDNIPSRKIAESLGGFVICERVRESMAGTKLNEVVYRIE